VRVSVSFLADQSEPERASAGSGPIISASKTRRSIAVQLISRRWMITDGHGARHRVEGEGVVGVQPVIEPGGSYDYVSGCPLDTPTGSMEGSYQMVGHVRRAMDGRFDVARGIPRFTLTKPGGGVMKRTHLPLNGCACSMPPRASVLHPRRRRAGGDAGRGRPADPRAGGDVLGVVLFRRTAKGLELTPEGAAGLDALRRGFLEFEEAVRAMQAGNPPRR
jgi:ApaG protein